MNDLENLVGPADLHGVSGCGRGATVLRGSVLFGTWAGAQWSVELGVEGPVSGLVVGQGRIAVGRRGRFALVDATEGRVLGRIGLSARDRLVRRGLVRVEGRDAFVVDGLGIRLVDAQTGDVLHTFDVQCPFIGSVDCAAVDAGGTRLAVGGSQGMDAGWYEVFAIPGGERLGGGGSGYRLDVVEPAPDGSVVILDDYLGVSGFPHDEPVQGSDLWRCAEAVLIQQRSRVLRLHPDGRQASWACDQPFSLCASDDGGLVGVRCSDGVRFATADLFGQPTPAGEG